LFDPKESIDFNGHTGPFIQYTHARIKSVLRRAAIDFNGDNASVQLNSNEKEIVKFIYDFEGVLEEAGKNFSPALIANYVYELTKSYNRFYHDYSILKEENESVKKFRLQLSQTVGLVISNAMKLLGITVPERM
ncbi:MAG: arginine--tRNA ligase, partial [Bacteroidia bacterium]|nr:arginine--tRNA ligase [Bacteroidia bacterium]